MLSTNCDCPEKRIRMLSIIWRFELSGQLISEVVHKISWGPASALLMLLVVVPGPLRAQYCCFGRCTVPGSRKGYNPYPRPLLLRIRSIPNPTLLYT